MNFSYPFKKIIVEQTFTNIFVLIVYITLHDIVIVTFLLLTFLSFQNYLIAVKKKMFLSWHSQDSPYCIKYHNSYLRDLTINSGCTCTLQVNRERVTFLLVAWEYRTDLLFLNPDQQKYWLAEMTVSTL